MSAETSGPREDEGNSESIQSEPVVMTADKTTPNTTVAESATPVKPVIQQIPKPKSTDKIQILLKATASSPAIKNQKWNVTRDRTVGGITQFLKKQLSMKEEETLFLYVKQTFSPSADVEIGALYECFGSDGRLVFYYCTMEAWG